MQQKNIRNFCIIAHIDHGKSTLADRILEHTGTVTKRELSEQMLDSMDLERERGITIKLTAVRLTYKTADNQEYVLNLIDTPGHVDFSYEVSRSLAACEGALLVIDASQGIEAQTLANLYLALENNLEIIPIINKIDLPNADPQRVIDDLEQIGIDGQEAILASAKTGEGISKILEAVVNRIPAPEGDPDVALQALIFDSHYDSYRGAVAYIRVVDGVISVGDQIQMMSSNRNFEVTDLGIFRPAMFSVKQLKPGEVGCVIASMKDVKDTRVGDTITHTGNPALQPLPGYLPAKPMVYCGLYPVDNEEYTDLREALDKLQLNDASLTYEPETSAALGFGFRCGFLGLLHMEIVQERIEREFDLNIITTAPSVEYRIKLTDDKVIFLDNPTNFPEIQTVECIEEPFVLASILVPEQFVGPVMELCQEKRGHFKNMEYLTPDRTKIEYEMPFSEILMDFFDRLKSKTKGYASLEYEFLEYKEADLVKLDILLNGNQVDALSCIIHRDHAAVRGRGLAKKLKEVIPRQQFEVPIQAAIGQKIIARETVRALRKDVIAKCYGGDISRKRKLLEKQKEGKKRMKNLGNVDIPQEAFMAILEVE